MYSCTKEVEGVLLLSTKTQRANPRTPLRVIHRRRPRGHSWVRRARLGAQGDHVAKHLVRLQAIRDRGDDVALALDDGQRDALGVERDEVLLDAARVVSAVVNARPLGVLVQGLDRWRREAAAERFVSSQSSNSLRLTRIASS